MDQKNNETQALKEQLRHLQKRVDHIEYFLSTFVAIGPPQKPLTPSELDERFLDAVRLVAEDGKASASLLQRRLLLGYARSARILDQMTEMGLVSSQDGTAKPRKVVQEKIEKYLAEND
ncbi:MAG: hypothetical protein M5U29_02575 [Anaerolineae bacterium]|nr:hypothetical protein [Anaerolineae bacterium]